MAQPPETWQEISLRAKTVLANSIPAEWRIPVSQLPSADRKDVTGFPAECGLLDALELEITESGAEEIVSRIAKGEWRTGKVVRGFCKRAAVAHQVTNCLTVTLFDSALQRARELDDYFATHGKTLGPLHGLPVSIKDNFNVKGKPSSVGFCSWALEPMEQDSTIVTLLEELGAVVFVKTNVPTAMMIAETVNNCYGRTVNPLNTNLTSGGSSGGESALLAIKGSPLGIGTDIGGSLRIPAACTGLFTLRPSYGRFPHFDARTGLSGQESVASVHGPMARSLADLELFASSVLSTKPWERDPKCIPLPWRSTLENLLPVKPKIAVLWHNTLVTPTPPVLRALQTTVSKLQLLNYNIVPWSPTDYPEANTLLTQFFVADGGRSLRAILDPTSEPFRPEMCAYETATDLGVYDLWQLQRQRTALQKRTLDRFRSQGIDAILSPTTPYIAPRHGDFKTVSYTGLWNLVDYACVSFPTGVYGDEEVDVYPEGFKALGELDGETRRDYDPREVQGLPVSLQLVAGRLEEEKVIGLCGRICEDIRGI